MRTKALTAVALLALVASVLVLAPAAGGAARAACGQPATIPRPC